MKVALSKVAMEVNARMQSGDATSARYMSEVIQALRGVKQSPCPEIQINCLLDASQYFYLIGQTFNAIEPAESAVRVATELSHDALLRKALTFLGVLFADTGNISRAIECYAQAL